jgi:archaemetzincin
LSGENRRGLELVSVGAVKEELLEFLGRELERRFGTRSFRGPPLPLSGDWRDPERGQYRSDDVLDALLARVDALGAHPRSLWSLGVTEADLYAPERAFVFGEATVGGPCAVVSVARLGAGSPRLRERALAEAVHELGHLAGLGHCSASSCVMHPTKTAEDVDRRGGELCPDCARSLRRFLSDPDACPPADERLP